MRANFDRALLAQAIADAVGVRLGEPRLAELGRQCEQEHDEMQREFNLLSHELFVEHASAA